MTTASDGGGHTPAVVPTLDNLVVTYRSTTSLKPYERNARTHSKKQVRQIAESIKTFGWTMPILLDANDRIIAGHARLEAAKLLGLTEVPTICRTNMSEAQIRAYCIADNKLAEEAGWDTTLLKLEFDEIIKLDPSLDITITGFELGELDEMLERGADPKADLVPPIDLHAIPLTKPGDRWILRDHRLLCGDARDPAALTQLMGGKRAQMVFTDPPWNIPIEGNVGGLGQIKHRDFAMAVGEMSAPEFIAFLAAVMEGLIEHSVDGSIHFICMDWRHMRELLTAGQDRYAELKNICVWNKSNGGMGSFYRSKHELVAVFKSGTGRHINNFELGQHGRHRTNVWDYAGANSLRPGRMEELRLHPTVKPVALVADAIKDCSRRGGEILDPFLGSGTTLIAAEQTGRRAYAIELDPRYVDTAIRRWQDFTGESATNAATGQTFDELHAMMETNNV